MTAPVTRFSKEDMAQQAELYANGCMCDQKFRDCMTCRTTAAMLRQAAAAEEEISTLNHELSELHGGFILRGLEIERLRRAATALINKLNSVPLEGNPLGELKQILGLSGIASPREEKDPDPSCKRCKGTGEEPNAQFSCSCRCRS